MLQYRTIAPSKQSFLATFTTERAAQEVMTSAPLRYHLVTEGHDGQDGQTQATTATSATPIGSEEATLESGSNHEFELHAHPSTLDHEKYITSPHTNPLYGPYKPSPTKRSYVANMLDNAVTTGMWSSGLKDWETDVERWEKSGAYDYDAKHAREGQVHGLSSKILGKIGELKIGLAEGSEAQKGMTERAVYTRAVRRRKKAIPEIMWGAKRFVDMRKVEERNMREGSLD